MSKDQNEAHHGVEHHGVIVTAAVIGVTVPEDATDDKPDGEQAFHEDEERRREVQPVLISIAKDRNLKEIQDALGQPNHEESEDPFADRYATLMLSLLRESVHEDDDRK